jgi:MFS family permease
MICHFSRAAKSKIVPIMETMAILFAVFALTMGNSTVYATLGLFARSIGLDAVQVGVIFSSSAVLFFLLSSGWGRRSDRRGRWPVVALGLVGTALSLFLFAGLFGLNRGDAPPSLIFAALLVARAIYGILASGTQPAATAYMAGQTTAKERSAGTALIGASVGLGSMAGPASAALLVGFGFPIPVLAASVLTVLAGLFLVAVREARYPAPAASAAKVGS